jgi:hypothetical protein
MLEILLIFRLTFPIRSPVQDIHEFPNSAVHLDSLTFPPAEEKIAELVARKIAECYWTKRMAAKRVVNVYILSWLSGSLHLYSRRALTMAFRNLTSAVFGIITILLALVPTCIAAAQPQPNHQSKRECIVRPGLNSSTDDAVTIRKAFHDCGQGGRVVCLDETYHINSVMNTTGLRDCEIYLYGTLLVCEIR